MHTSYTNYDKKAIASNGKAAVMVINIHGQLLPGSYAPSSISEYQNSEEYDKLFARAAAKLGYKRDRRCRNGWRNLNS